MNNNLSGSYYLTNDIDCSDTVNWNSGAGFTSVGSVFRGTFDGKGYKITDLYINKSANYTALFRTTQNANIKNVHISGNITGLSFVGFLIGSCQQGTTINNVSSSGSVNGSSYVGGLIGNTIYSSVITNSYSTANVTGTNSYIGGFTGRMASGPKISTSYATGDVSGNSFVGGFSGNVETANIDNAYATGNVSGNNYVGGLIGNFIYSSTITNCYSKGYISGSSNVGGLVGRLASGPTVTTSYWNTQTSGQSTSSGGTGKTTVAMQTQTTYSGWDFSSVWCMPSGDYPRLKWEDACQLPTCTGCAVLSGDTCVAGSSCSGELPTCSVSENHGICVCNAGSCNDGRKCSGTTCVNCASSAGCGACGCGTSQKPTGAGSCLSTNACCPGECNAVTGANSCSYSDALCAGSACNRSTLSCCATSLPYWRSSACKACSSTSGLSGACTTQGMECNGNYNCVPCNANDQCTCDAGEVANGSGSCVTPVCSDDSECGVDQCINAGQYNAFCTNCSTYSQIWYGSSCASCPADAVYASGVCLCNDGKVWNRSTNSCFERGVTTSSGDLINLKRNNSNSATGRYDRIKSRMNRIRSKIQNGTGDK